MSVANWCANEHFRMSVLAGIANKLTPTCASLCQLGWCHVIRSFAATHDAQIFKFNDGHYSHGIKSTILVSIVNMRACYEELEH